MFENMTQFWEWYLFTVVYGWVIYYRAFRLGERHASSKKDESR